VPRLARKPVTVLCSQLSEAAALAEALDPEVLQAVLARFGSTARAAVERHGGTLEAAPGDSVNAVFGVPAAHEDDALRAIRAAVELRDTLDTPEDGLAVRTGLSSGEVLVGGSTGGRIATGAAVELAGRLARKARPGEITLAQTTYELTRGAVDAQPDERHFRLVELLPDAGRRALRLESALVGRQRQLQGLQRSFEDVVEDRSSRLFTVLGTAGVGKSRLLREFVDSLDAAATILQGRCLPYGEGITFWPLAEALEETQRDEVLPLLTRQALDDEILAATQSLLEALADRKPLVLVVDDLQWAEPAFLDLVQHVAERSRESPLLIVCLARPELLDLRPKWGGGLANASSILLEPLADAECEELIDNLLGDSDLPDPVRQHLVRSSDGNPLFLEELLASLVDRDVLRQEAGRWTTTELPVLTVPPSLRALIASRIDLLGEDERLVLELASVEGKRFHSESVVNLAPDELRSRVGPLLAGLVRRELIRPPAGHQDPNLFRHQLVRDCAYESIPKQERAELHDRLSQCLEEPAAAYHREQAIRYRTELGLESV